MNWTIDRFQRIAPGVVHAGWGSTGEPEATRYLGRLTEAMGPFFREGLKILDYGCGTGRYGNFLSGHLQSFTYYGLDRRGGGPYSIYQDEVSMSEKGIALGKETYGHDSRIHLGFFGDPIEQEALASADTVLLSSIFTHLDQDKVETILQQLTPIVQRGGCIVFTIFFNSYYDVRGPGAYGHPDCYQMAYHTRPQLEKWCQTLKWRTIEYPPYEITSQLDAHIFRAELA